jgi:cytochrome c biogenesis factor
MSQSIPNPNTTTSTISDSDLLEVHPITLHHVFGTAGLTLLLSVLSGLVFIQITLATETFYKASLALLMIPLVIPAVISHLLNRPAKRLYIVTTLMMMMMTTLTFATLAMAVYTESDLMGALSLMMTTPNSEIVAMTVEHMSLNPILMLAYVLFPVLSLVMMLKKKAQNEIPE